MLAQLSAQTYEACLADNEVQEAAHENAASSHDEDGPYGNVPVSKKVPDDFSEVTRPSAMDTALKDDSALVTDGKFHNTGGMSKDSNTRQQL